MSLATSQDLIALMDGQDFADNVTLSDGCEIVGFFHHGYSESLEMNGRRPMIIAVNESVDNVIEGDAVEVRSLDYIVQAIEPGDRMTRLILGTP